MCYLLQKSWESKVLDKLQILKNYGTLSGVSASITSKIKPAQCLVG